MPPEIHIPGPGGRPRHQKQLQTGAPTEGVDCGVITCLHAIEYASWNRISPRGDAVKRWVRLIRAWMTPIAGIWPATALLNQQQALASDELARIFRERGLDPPRMRILQPGSQKVLADALRAGAWVSVGVDYGTVNDELPHMSGSETFRGGHHLGLVGHGEDRNGREWAFDYDPLFDGRRSGIPRGPQPTVVDRFMVAAEAFGTPPAGRGRAKFGIVRRSHRRD